MGCLSHSSSQSRSARLPSPPPPALLSSEPQVPSWPSSLPEPWSSEVWLPRLELSSRSSLSSSSSNNPTDITKPHFLPFRIYSFNVQNPKNIKKRPNKNY